jgi:Reverse transcriptase (RNA-dependent DNA polymerase)
VGAYLQAFMDWIVYIMLPVKLAEYFPDLAEWFGVPLLLYKSAYGMNSAGCLWAEDLFRWYSNYSFLQSSVEPALFTYKKGDDWIILLSYCNDTAYYTSSNTIRQQLKTAQCSCFESKLLGQLHWLLQARITQSDHFNITLDQSWYAASICQCFLPESDDIHQIGLTFTKLDCSVIYFVLCISDHCITTLISCILTSFAWIVVIQPQQ